MKLNKLQRHTAYIIMLEEAQKRVYSSFGFCGLISCTQNLDGLFPFNAYHKNALKINLPELYSKKPKALADHAYWFETNNKGWDIRIALLKECIEETY